MKETKHFFLSDAERKGVKDMDDYYNIVLPGSARAWTNDISKAITKETDKTIKRKLKDLLFYYSKQ